MALAPARKRGHWQEAVIISEEMSMNMLTRPSAQMPRGIPRRPCKGSWAVLDIVESTQLMRFSGLAGGLSPQTDMLCQPVVTILQRLRIVQIVAGVVVQHLLGLARGSRIMLHRSLVEVLFVVGKL